MGRSEYARELDWFKRNEKPEPVLLVANCPQQLRLVVAWTNTTVRRRRRLTKAPNGSEADRWEWLWENTDFSRDELMAKSAVPKESFDTKLPALIGSRVFYPDGTINSFVGRYLREKVLKLFGQMPARRR
jgi:hypothetical protein